MKSESLLDTLFIGISFLCIAAMPQLCHAQVEDKNPIISDSVIITDSLAKKTVFPSAFSYQLSPDFSTTGINSGYGTMPPNGQYNGLGIFSLSQPATNPTDSLSLFINPIRPLTLNMPSFYPDPNVPAVASWNTGRLFATGSTGVFPGLMNIDRGAIGITQQIGNLSITASALANKYGYFRGVHTQYGVEGNLTYSFSPKVSATAFGSYYFGQPPTLGPGLPMPPSMIGFYNTSHFGGYVDYDISEHFGMLLGAQMVEQIGYRPAMIPGAAGLLPQAAMTPGPAGMGPAAGRMFNGGYNATSRYVFEPIATPYIKFGSGKRKIKIGLPVGQILHGLLRR